MINADAPLTDRGSPGRPGPRRWMPEPNALPQITGRTVLASRRSLGPFAVRSRDRRTSIISSAMNGRLMFVLLSVQPTDHRPGDQVGCVLLDEMAGPRDRYQREVGIDPVPGIVERPGETAPSPSGHGSGAPDT